MSDDQESDGRNSNHRQSRAHKVVVALLLIFLILSVLFIGMLVREHQQDVSRSKRELEQTLQAGKTVPGVSCAILNDDRISALLNEAATRASGNMVQPVVGQPDYWVHRDNCRYEARDNSNKYVEFHITTYSEAELAENEFEKRLPAVEEAVDEQSPPGFEKAVYDAGVHYGLRDKQIVEAAASNGKPSEDREFSSKIFNDLVKLLPSLKL